MGYRVGALLCRGSMLIAFKWNGLAGGEKANGMGCLVHGKRKWKR